MLTPNSSAFAKPAICSRRSRSCRYLALTGWLLLGAIATGCRPPPEPVLSPPPAISVSQPVECEITDYAEFTARVAAVETTEVRARVSGQIIGVPFEPGAAVQQGALLVEIDAQPFQAELEARIADESRAAAQTRLAQIEFQRIDRLPPDVRTATEYDTVVAELEAAHAVEAAAKAAVKSARLNVEWCRVVAPISGRISYKHATTGNLVTGGVGSGTLLTTIVSCDPVYANFDVDDRTVQRVQKLIREGKLESNEAASVPVWLGLATESGFPHRGTINFVDNQVNPRTGTLRVRGVFPNTDGALTPGFFARVRVPVSAPHKALLVSERALSTDQGQKIVFIVRADNKIAAHPVQIGALHDGLREITDGLKAGEQVVVNGLLHVRPGLPVAPQPTEMPRSAAAGSHALMPQMSVASNPETHSPKE